MLRKVLIGCEYSGVMRRAFRALGHEAWSCDLLPSDDDSPYHIVGDVLEVAKDSHWDLMVAHPVCKYLCNSGVKHLYINGKAENGRYEPRWEDMRQGAAFYNALANLPIKLKAIENPVMHGHAIALCRPPGTVVQFVQPWWFGDKAFKATGFQLYGLPKLRPTNKLVPPKPNTQEHKDWSFIHRMAKSEQRSHERSRTFPGIAAAAAAQWGSV
jgi:hypothetical protein